MLKLLLGRMEQVKQKENDDIFMTDNLQNYLRKRGELT
jgi:hypothetical protein